MSIPIATCPMAAGLWGVEEFQVPTDGRLRRRWTVHPFIRHASEEFTASKRAFVTDRAPTRQDDIMETIRVVIKFQTPPRSL